MDENIHYVYIAKDEKDFKSVSASAKKMKCELPLYYNKHVKCFIICRPEACDALDAELRDQKNVDPQKIKDLFDACRENRAIGNGFRVIFLIHFGWRDEKTCREETTRMNQAISKNSDLNRHYFVSVSRTNLTPSFFFTNKGALKAPRPEDDINEEIKAENRNDPFMIRLIENWEGNGSVLPGYDHLRGISILCRTLLEMGEKERDSKLAGPGTDWWFQTIWDGTHPKSIEDAFSTIEQKVLKKDDRLMAFCSEFLKEKLVLEQYDKELSDIMLRITTTINNIK